MKRRDFLRGGLAALFLPLLTKLGPLYGKSAEAASLPESPEITEDVSDIIYQITPEDSPLFVMVADGDSMRSMSVPSSHNWWMRPLKPRAP